MAGLEEDSGVVGACTRIIDNHVGEMEGFVGLDELELEHGGAEVLLDIGRFWLETIAMELHVFLEEIVRLRIEARGGVPLEKEASGLDWGGAGDGNGAERDDTGAIFAVEVGDVIISVGFDFDASVGLVEDGGIGVLGCAVNFAETIKNDVTIFNRTLENLGDSTTTFAGDEFFHIEDDVFALSESGGVFSRGFFSGVATIETVVIFEQGDFGVFNTSLGGVVGGLGEFVVGGLGGFGENNTEEAKGDDAEEDGGENDNVDRGGGGFGGRSGGGGDLMII